MTILTEIPADYVKKVESIISSSYNDSERFLSVSIFLILCHFKEMISIQLF